MKWLMVIPVIPLGGYGLLPNIPGGLGWMDLRTVRGLIVLSAMI